MFLVMPVYKDNYDYFFWLCRYIKVTMIMFLVMPVYKGNYDYVFGYACI